MSESRKEAKENQGERSKNAVKVKAKSHYCTHIEQLKPKITFKEQRQTQVKPWVNHKKSTEKTPFNSELIHLSHCSFLFSWMQVQQQLHVSEVKVHSRKC